MCGQRWVSETEPELGLGIVLKSEFGRAEIFFPASGEHRQYALSSAPVRRVRFQEGDSIRTHSGERLGVDAIREEAGMLVYVCGSREVREAELSDQITFSRPEDRLMAGQVDEIERHRLRVEALQWQRDIRQNPARGFAGARIDLIPHQLSIAAEVASRLAPRVLLADEVGLGKTIEAGLILHRLHLTGRAGRVLVLVPPALVNQWFVEMFRRFDLSFAIFDEERCASLDAHETNPFLDSQLVLCSLDFLAHSERRAIQAREAGWELLVVDEAHHLEWSTGGSGTSYQLVESLAALVPSLLLLTATPHQLGAEGHFARLRLLDPARFADLESFVREHSTYEDVASVIDAVRQGKKPARTAFLKGHRLGRDVSSAPSLDEAARGRLVSSLLDEFGTGRVMFRNVRAALSGFPKRKAHLEALETDSISWLAALLRKHKSAKFLVITHSREQAVEALNRLQTIMKVPAALFHEDLTLLQRDRNAAFFAEEDGARVLICSEIGSEGRNFQFAHHLVLLDVPENPELLEQRIGRLDRIGQSSTIHIHVPFVSRSPVHALVRWYHEGLNAFEKTPHGALALKNSMEEALRRVGDPYDEDGLDALIEKTRTAHREATLQLQSGHDRLLEWNSHKPALAAPLIEGIRRQDDDPAFEAFFIRLLDHLGVPVEELGSRSYLLRSSDAASLPGLSVDGLMVTMSRARALAREEIAFITPDHPLVRAALDATLGDQTGNAVFAIRPSAGVDGILLEVESVLEVVAPAAWHADRFLPATPLRVVVDQALNDRSDDEDFRNAPLVKGDVFSLLDLPAFKKKHFPAMLAKAREFATRRKDAILANARLRADDQLQAEIERLQDLQKINPSVRSEEIESLKTLKEGLAIAISEATLRTDALLLVLQRSE